MLVKKLFSKLFTSNLKILTGENLENHKNSFYSLIHKIGKLKAKMVFINLGFLGN